MHLLDDPRRVGPTVDREGEGGFADENITFDRLERRAGRVRLALVVARYSTCCAETRRGRTRSLSMVGKLFPTTDPNHATPLKTANFMTQDDIGGSDTEFINAVELRNAPDTTLSRRGSGVPILQALTIVKETSGNVVVSDAVSSVHESVKEGETITAPLEASNVFPPMVISMVDVGEQTGALPEMLMKIADTYDDEVDNAVSAMTSLLEPIMIVFLAVIVGSIVIALFLPLISLIDNLGSPNDSKKGED